MWQRITIAVMLVALTGCASQYGPDSPFYKIPLDSKIRVLKPFEIPPKTAHVTFQNGRIADSNKLNAVDYWYTNCRFEVSIRGDAPQTVEPDTFAIRKIENNNYPVSGRSVINYYTKFYLEPTQKSPHVLYLTCAQYNGPMDFDYPSIPQMRKAWGDYLDIVLPPGAEKTATTAGAPDYEKADM